MKHLLLLLLIFSVSDSHAQKLKKEGYGFISFIQPRNSTVLDDAELYTVDIYCESGDKNREDVLRTNFFLDNFNMTSNYGADDFKIQIIESAFRISDKERKINERKKKKNDQEYIENWYYYEFKLNYTHTIIVSQDGAEIYKKRNEYSEKFTSNQSKSMSDANKYYTEKVYNLRNDTEPDGLKTVKRWFTEEFTNTVQTAIVRGHYVVEKKHKYPLFKEAYSDFDSAMVFLKKNDEADEEVKRLLTNSINIWLDWVKDATPDEKKSQKNAKVTAAAYWNLGIAYFFLEDYKNSMEMLDQAMALDKNVDGAAARWFKRATTHLTRMNAIELATGKKE